MVDEDWRAICFSSGEPRGLSVSLPEILGQLKEVVGDGPAMVGFDRGGSYPKVFSALYQAGMDWVTWRRAPLVAPSVPARRTWVTRDGRRRYLLVCDETIELTGYEGGPVRQLSATEGGKIVFQVLTSNFAFRPAPLVFKLKGRWSIENFNKYAEDHYGVHWLSTYEMDEEDDTQLVKNPERSAARATLRAATTALSDAERALGQAMEEDHQSVTARIAAVTERRDDVTVAKDAIEAAKAAVKGVPARLPANEVHPGKKRAKPRLAVRALQMVCRLLSYNAELDLARRLNAYLDDPDEYRAITRNLLHLSGTITHRRARVEVTLDRPDAPRVARALGLLIDELNAGPVVHMTGDRRPLTYRLAPSELNS
ncbi:MAG: putative transposase [Acidimicrobiales bacterium]